MDFMGKRKLWFLISLMVIIPGLISMAVQGLNLGIDFAGGNKLQIEFAQHVTLAQVREVMADFDLGKNPIQPAENNQFIIRTPVLAEEENQALIKSFEEKLGQLTVLSNEKVGPVIGKELTRNALLALLIASVLMVIYITIRFQFSFAIAAIIALLHDVLVTLSIFSLAQIEINSSFVAALLTIIGYSINDTIVIYDRIRENLKHRKKESLEVLLNNSISQTIVRSINTSATTLFAVAALLVLGGATTRVFALALLVGLFSGTYSSIFTASPVWLELKMWQQRKRGIGQHARA